MELRERLPVEGVVEQMNAQSPDGFVVLGGKYVDARAPKLMAMANYAVYRLTGPIQDGYGDDALQQALQAFNDASDVRKGIS